MEEKPSYYSIIPASVRYDKTLKANEKILYSEITVLCNKKGYCYASNDYFANLYNVHKNTISVWINNLRNRGYIGTQITYKEDSKEVDKRIIYLSEVVLREIAENYCKKNEGGINEIINTHIRNHLYPINENIEENNTSINIYTTTNNSDEKNLYDLLQENGFTLSPLHYEVISTWEDNELTRYAIKKAVLNNKYTINYIDKILYNWKKENINTIQEAQAKDEEFNKAKQFKKKVKTKKKKTQIDLLDERIARYEEEERLKNEQGRSK